jgi:hypothetical protein
MCVLIYQLHSAVPEPLTAHCIGAHRMLCNTLHACAWGLVLSPAHDSTVTRNMETEQEQYKSHDARATYTDTPIFACLCHDSLTCVPRLYRLIGVLPLQCAPGCGYVSILLEQMCVL